MRSAAARYIARCRIAGDMRPYEKLLCEIVDGKLAARLAADLLNRAWQH